jgi:[protein-PII] uridylyltransferase
MASARIANRPVAAPPPRERIGLWKERLAEARRRLHEAFQVRDIPGDLLRRQAALVDRQLKEVWEDQRMPREVALAAVGGYGRGQLFPCSDVDLLVLLPAPAAPETAHKLESLVGTVWDIGLDVGHSVRTINECVELSAEDVTVQTTLLEARLLAGDAALFERFRACVRDHLDPAAFLQAKLLEQQQRHARYAESSLEPNIKESAGGLRDLQTILWVAQATHIGSTWRALTRAGLITTAEMREILQHERFLQSLRIRLHYRAGRREDRLLFDYQTALAHELGRRDRAHRLASEQLMQRYYRTAKAVSQLNTIVLQNLSARVAPADDGTYRPINERFGALDERLELSEPLLFERRPHAILECFRLLQQHHELKGMSASTLRALWRARVRITPSFRRDPANRAQFMELLRSPDRVERVLRSMNENGVLGRYLPAFGRIVGQMQHDLYHVHTVDEHTLRVVRNLRRFSIPELAHEFPLCSRLMSNVERPELLYLAALFHDIAKGRGGDHSRLGARDARRFCRAHDLPQEDADLVAWLVESHLVMSSTAQKQDIADPEVVGAFARSVRDEHRLTALYLLTVADIRGTNPKIWNAWKAKLLEDLYWLTRRRLAGDRPTLASSLLARQEAAHARLRLYAVPERAHETLWAELNDAYFLRHEPQEIAWHTRLLYHRVSTGEPVIRARLSPAGEGLQVMIYVPDQQELFARICSFFERIGYNIVEAKIYTTRHGYALDSFQVQDPANSQPQYRDVIALIEHELTERLKQKAPLPPLNEPRLSRQLRHFPISPEVNLQPDERGIYWVLSVIAGDRPGLLSRIARVLAAHGISLHTAKINTLGARAEDVFLVTGATLRDPRNVVRLESDLVAELRTT